MFSSFWGDLLITLIVYFLGLGTKLGLELIKNTRPTKKLWKIKNNADVYIVTANTPIETRVVSNEFAVTGYISEYMAADNITSFLERVYKKIKFEIDMQCYFNYKNVTKDVIVIGGPVNNPLTRKIFDKVNLPFKFVDYDLVNIQNQKVYKSEINIDVAEQYIEKDYCLIVNMMNPLDNDDDSRAIIIAGCRTLGCYAGAKFLTRDYKKISKSLSNMNIDESELQKSNNYALVIETSGYSYSVIGTPKLVDVVIF